ncbi:MAG: hypothetical protein JKY53_08750 [Flavobacteriales bacterium]|nr:hypothetical protein [Flavobacteriales bacterium]
MKKVLTIVAVIAMTLSFSSCKKSYDCECTDLGGATTTRTEKGKNATDACNDSEDTIIGIPIEDCVPA